MGELTKQLYERYDLPEMYITENGACYNMGVVNGEVDDQPRLDYYGEHISVCADLIRDAVPLRGYFAWSLMDNFEWAEGYSHAVRSGSCGLRNPGTHHQEKRPMV